MDMVQAASIARKASIALACEKQDKKNLALRLIAEKLLANKEEIFRKNQLDLERSQNENLPAPLLKRLKFGEKKLADVVAGIQSLINLPEPVGKKLLATELDDGLKLYKITCPIGVIGIIFESRPDALVQISTQCIRS